MVKTRLWLAGEVSEHRDLTLSRRRIARVHAWAQHRPRLCCTDGLCAYSRAIRGTLRDPVRIGVQERPRLRPCRNVCIAQVGKRYVQRRVVEVERRTVDGILPRVETLRCRSHGDGVINTEDIERLNAPFRERVASLTRRGRTLARRTLILRPGGPVVRGHQPWLLGSRITAGQSRSCCRFMSHRRAGHLPHNVGILRLRSNA